MRTYTAKELLSPANTTILDDIVLVLTHSFIEDPCHKWLLGVRDVDRYTAALPQYFRFLVHFALACDATTSIVTKDELPSSSKSAETPSARRELGMSMPASSTVRAVCMTIPPHGNAAFDSLLVSIRAGVLSLTYNCGFGILWRLLTTWVPMLNGMHDKIFPNPATKYHNWYLFYVAVHPECQGLGVGGEMLVNLQQHVRQFNDLEKEKAKAQGTSFNPAPLFLEAGSRESQRLYNRMGFEDICTGIYGTLEGDDDVTIGKDGTVLGGKQYGMVWQPS